MINKDLFLESCLIILLSILIYPIIKYNGQILAAKILKIKIKEEETHKGNKSLFYRIKQAILLKFEVCLDYNSLREDPKQNWKLAIFYFVGPLLYTFILSIIFFGSFAVIWLLYSASTNPEYWDNIFTTYGVTLLLSLMLGWFICIWCSLFPLPWRRNCGFKTLVCLQREITKKPITKYPCVDRIGEDEIWGNHM